ncbi:hypothetical protein AGMMS49938_04840 [Fibrobacterales bacterium]|nr:hypothetical protein AGMMS49938_04840 [Fibrobacterales bacterium]
MGKVEKSLGCARVESEKCKVESTIDGTQQKIFISLATGQKQCATTEIYRA